MKKLKIIILGDVSVGKTSLSEYLINNRLSDNSTTVGLAFYMKHLVINDEEVCLNIWDTAGQEKYRSIVELYYRGAMGAMFVFDLTNLDTFERLSNWIDDYIMKNKNGKYIIVANKCDINRQYWYVIEKEVMELAKKYNCEYIYTSCISGFNVISSFELLTKIILNEYIDETIEDKPEPVIVEDDNTNLFKKKCYCN